MGIAFAMRERICLFERYLNDIMADYLSSSPQDNNNMKCGSVSQLLSADSFCMQTICSTEFKEQRSLSSVCCLHLLGEILKSQNNLSEILCTVIKMFTYSINIQIASLTRTHIGFYLAPGLSRRDIIVTLNSPNKPSYCFLHPFFYSSSVKPMCEGSYGILEHLFFPPAIFDNCCAIN